MEKAREYSFVRPSERKELAKAVCAWLAYKDLTGGQKILSEAMLTLPISEYLATGTTWQLKPEYPYKKLKDASSLPDFGVILPPLQPMAAR